MKRFLSFLFFFLLGISGLIFSSGMARTMQTFTKPKIVERVPNIHQRIHRKATRTWVTEETPLISTEHTRLHQMYYQPSPLKTSTRVFAQSCAGINFKSCVQKHTTQTLPQKTMVRRVQYGFDHKIRNAQNVQTAQAKIIAENGQNSILQVYIAGPDASLYVFTAITPKQNRVNTASALYRMAESAYFAY